MDLQKIICIYSIGPKIVTVAKEQFIAVPYSIAGNKDLNDGDKLTLSLIYSLYNNTQNVYISNNRLGSILGISRTAASERITKLENMGYIKCVRFKNKSNQKRYIVPIDMVGKANEVVGEPNRVVAKPNRVVGVPTTSSRHTDHQVVGEAGSIIYTLLDYKLEYILDYNIKLEELDSVDMEKLTPEQRGNFFQLKNYLIKTEKENEQTRNNRMEMEG